MRSEANGDHVAAVTAEAAGSLTSASQIPASARFVTVSSSNANYIVTLPNPIQGHEIWIQTDASTACELRTPAASGNTINNVDSDGTNEAALVATNTYHCIATSTTGWLVVSFTNLAADVGALIPD